jgi:preprotein translocase subunit Sss1
MSARSAIRTKPKPRMPPRDGFLGRLLDPIDRLSETVYSVLILLTFTLAYRIILVNQEARLPPSDEYINQLLVAAIGAIVAWGIIDGLVYILMEVFQRGERHRLLNMIHTAETDQQRVEIIAEELDYIMEPITDEHEREQLYLSVLRHLRNAQPRPIRFKREDFTGALGCFVVAVIAVIPSLTPFLLLRNNYELAIRISNVISFGVLFHAGYSWGTYTGASPIRTGLILAAAGALMVAIAIPLGG